MDKPAQCPFYIRLIGPQLPKEIAKEWATVVKGNLPPGVMGSVQVPGPDGNLTSVYMIHKTLKSGEHKYEIPLVRDLVPNEALEIIQAWDALYPEGEHEIETSAEDIEAARQGPTDAVVIGETDYNQFCETLAKHQHSRWCDQRTKAGWRFGTEYNLKERTHPLLRPWEQLPERYQNVDYELPHMLMEMLAQNGYAVVKRTDLAKWIK